MTVDYKPSFCFVAHHAYGALSGRFTGHIGGVERQQSFMARWLASRGYAVSMLTWDEGAVDGEQTHGVRVFNICRKESGIRGIRFFYPRWTALIAAMVRANADLYYQNCGEYVTGQVAWWCKKNKRKFVYSIASDPDVDPSLPEMKTLRERILYRYGLRHADQIVVQTTVQQNRLKSGWDLNSTLIPMPGLADSGERTMARYPTDKKQARVLWVGRIDEVKRLEWLIQIARLCPGIQFDVIGKTHGDNEYVRSLDNQAMHVKNIVRHGYVPPEHLADYYARASVLCCTSRHEGFPNTFLEAWSQGVPVVSTVDPDGLIVRKKLGSVATDVPGLASAIQSLLDSREWWEQASENARIYYQMHHTPERVMLKFEQLFCETLKGE